LNPSVAIVVPVLNEGAAIADLLEHLAALRADEIIVADGNSTDDTVARARRGGRARVLSLAVSNRGDQMNAGASAALSDILLFLHADTRPGLDAIAALRTAMADPSVVGGNFDIRYDGGAVSEAFSRVNRLRRRCGIFYGDSGIFCRRAVFESLGGFRSWPIMEDYEFARRLMKRGRLALLDYPIAVSDRRWRNGGLVSTLSAWVLIQALFMLGVRPERLARLYHVVR
jgi:rSAM/selenodomain-associated transferase 2